MWANILTRVKTEKGMTVGYKVRVNRTSSEYKDFIITVDDCIKSIYYGLLMNAVTVNGVNSVEVKAKVGDFKDELFGAVSNIDGNTEEFKAYVDGFVKRMPAETLLPNTAVVDSKPVNKVTHPIKQSLEHSAEKRNDIDEGQVVKSVEHPVKVQTKPTKPVKIEDLINDAYSQKIDNGDVKQHGFQLSKTLTDKHSDMTVEKKIVKSMISLQKIRPFYSILYQSLNRIETQDLETMGVTVDTLYFNPEFVASLEFAELLFIHMHEILHIAMLHPSRSKDKNRVVYNIACDLIINKILSEEFGISVGQTKNINGVNVKMPNHALYDSSIDLKIESADTLYEKLMKNKNDQDNTTCSGAGGKKFSTDENSLSNQKNKDIYYSSDLDDSAENTKDSNGNTQAKTEKDIYDQKRKEERLRGKVQTALTKSKLMAGDGSSNIERMVQNAIAPVVDWKPLLKKYMTDVAESYLSLSNPDKRYVSRGIILPGNTRLEPTIIKAMKICIDTSGSMSDEDLGIAYNQIKGIFDLFKTNLNQLDAEVLYWDTQLASRGMFNTMQEFEKIKPSGGGGTDVNCVFKYFETVECKIKPNVIIIFTDGCFYRPIDTKWKYTKNVIWVINGNEKAFKPPFGKVAKFIK